MSLSTMPLSRISLLAMLSAGICFSQARAVPTGVAALAPQTTLPITFIKATSANRSKVGDTVIARTTQSIRLANGQEVRSGAEVLAHVVRAQTFVFDKTPYAKQAEAVLEVQFDTLMVEGQKVPLNVYLRAIADTFATQAAFEPTGDSDEDPLHSTTQVGGDIRTPSRSEIVDRSGDTVGYNRRGGNFAHLIATIGAGGTHCDGTNREQPISVFSASACGVYGFQGLALSSTGYESNSSHFALSSTRRTPEILTHSSALLEVLPTAVAVQAVR